MEPISWNALEFEHKVKTNDWYWTVGVIAVILSVWRFYVGDYVLGIFIVLSGLCLIMLGGHKPEQIDILIDEEGIIIGHNSYVWSNVLGYAIVSAGGKVTLILETTAKLVPIVTLDIPEGIDPEAVNTIMSSHVEPKDLLPSRSQAILKIFGF